MSTAEIDSTTVRSSSATNKVQASLSASESASSTQFTSTTSTGLRLPLNNHGLPILTPVTTPGAEHCHDHTIYSPTVHYKQFHESSHELANVFSQVPWMRFSIVAQPDLNVLANTPAVTAFVNQVTEMTIAAVSKEIHQQITVAVQQVISNIGTNMNKTMKDMHANIMQEIVSVNAHKTATAHGRLGFNPFDKLVQELKVDKHDCHCPTDPPPKPTPEEPVPSKPVVTAPPKPSVVLPPTLQAGSWIWSPEYKKNPQPAAGHTRAFRRTINTPAPVNALILDVAADDVYTVYVNGKLVGSGKEWRQPDRYTIRFEPTSRVVVAIIASQGTPQADVGLIAAGKLWNTADPNPMGVEFGTDAQWITYTANDVSPKFFESTFVDNNWTPAHVITSHGAAPWRDIKPVTAGKAAGQRITGVAKVPDAPEAPIAEEWKL
ncbi:hypothetical protein BJ165DRAFT_1593057 [Panaeolus papilionaceus]|nr:hypothetical protein BJ165DRAFT_1593057 [Panaeolus papilionaceus]